MPLFDSIDSFNAREKERKKAKYRAQQENQICRKQNQQ
jgi:hypothetical protein